MENQKIYRVLAFDLDGTLTNSQKQVTQRTKETIRRCIEAGCVAVLASGRSVDGIMPVAKALELDRLGGYIVALNGARITDCRTGECLWDVPIPRELLPDLCRYIRENGLPALTYVPGGEITNRPDHPQIIREAACNALPLIYVEDFEASLPDPVENIMVIDYPEPLKEACEEMNALFGDRLTIYRSDPCFMEVLPMGVHKAGGLEEILKILGCEMSEMIAFGDGVNDLEMIASAGLGVCMANGADEVKAAADYVTASNDEDGVALALERFVLGEAQSTK